MLENDQKVSSAEAQTEADAEEQEASAETHISSSSRKSKLDEIDFDNIEDMSEIYEQTLKDFEEGEVVKGAIKAAQEYKVEGQRR